MNVGGAGLITVFGGGMCADGGVGLVGLVGIIGGGGSIVVVVGETKQLQYQWQGDRFAFWNNFGTVGSFPRGVIKSKITKNTEKQNVKVIKEWERCKQGGFLWGNMYSRFRVGINVRYFGEFLQEVFMG